MNYQDKIFSRKNGIELIQKWGDNIKQFIATPHQDYELAVAEFISKHYLKDSLILPTVSAITRVGFAEIHSYFCDFLSRNPTLILTNNDIDSVHVTLSQPQVGVMCGYYSFLIKEAIVNARYCMQFQYLERSQEAVINLKNRNITLEQSSGWYIVMKHSSFCPTDN